MLSVGLKLSPTILQPLAFVSLDPFIPVEQSACDRAYDELLCSWDLRLSPGFALGVAVVVLNEGCATKLLMGFVDVIHVLAEVDIAK
ncbi:hypothetical protein Tco_0551276 [Tanacetum coccineum]